MALFLGVECFACIGTMTNNYEYKKKKKQKKTQQKKPQKFRELYFVQTIRVCDCKLSYCGAGLFGYIPYEMQTFDSVCCDPSEKLQYSDCI